VTDPLLSWLAACEFPDLLWSLFMGDHRAGSTGPTATTAPGKRIARHAAEQPQAQPYAGRRVARVAQGSPAPVPTPVPTPPGEALTYVGRRVAGRNPAHIPVTVPPPPAEELDDVSAHLLEAPALVAPPVLVQPALAPPVLVPLVMVPPVRTGPLTPIEAPPASELEMPVTEPEPEPELEMPVTEPEPEPEPSPQPHVVAPKRRNGGQRIASRRTRVPSLPLLAGVAVLAISAGGALQAMQPGLAGTDASGRISPAGALSGSSAVGSANLLGGRGTVVSRNSDRQALAASSGNLRAAADAQAEQRDAVLSALAGQAEKQAARIKLHQWVLPVTPGVYHLTARFGDYSSLWSHFHTGLDFAAPTGTPIMAVAGGTITEVGYSGAYGNRTIERLADGTELWYCHQNEFGTSVGATVKPGQVIGYIGSPGTVTGPPLHLEVHPGGGDPVDPYTALVVHGLNP
jgi:murein DD-endopeptidase MepM/ murein hydrolase activator NlpD